MTILFTDRLFATPKLWRKTWSQRKQLNMSFLRCPEYPTMRFQIVGYPGHLRFGRYEVVRRSLYCSLSSRLLQSWFVQLHTTNQPCVLDPALDFRIRFSAKKQSRLPKTWLQEKYHSDGGTTRSAWPLVVKYKEYIATTPVGTIMFGPEASKLWFPIPEIIDFQASPATAHHGCSRTDWVMSEACFETRTLVFNPACTVAMSTPPRMNNRTT